MIQPASSVVSFSSSRVFSAFALVTAAILTVSASSTARAQDLSLVVDPSETTLDECDGPASIQLDISLENVDTDASLSGYQIFLRYDAESVIPTSFESAPYFISVFGTDGDSLTSGFTACPTWSDGAADDVVALAATIYPLDDTGAIGVVPEETTVSLGTLTFEPAEGAARPIDAAFSYNVESCRELFDDVTMVFDKDGSALAFSTSDIASVSIVSSSGVENLSCAFDGDDAVDLSWELPAGADFERIRILREGEAIKDVPGSSTEYRDATVGALEQTDVNYTVLPILADDVEGCAASCTALGEVPDVPFLRGDVDADARRTISDSVLVLQYLFRDEGDPIIEITCEDAADFDDDGRIVLTDPIYGLDFLFRRGRVIPEPLLEPGIDPTDDELSCRAWGG